MHDSWMFQLGSNPQRSPTPLKNIYHATELCMARTPLATWLCSVRALIRACLTRLCRRDSRQHAIHFAAQTVKMD
jgi:hypothetical protein